MTGKVKSLTLLVLTSLVLTGCIEDDFHRGKIEVPPSQVGIESPIKMAQSGYDSIYVEYQSEFQIGKAKLDFEPRGIIRGKQSPLIPLGKSSSQLEALGLTTHLSHDGNEAVLQYGDDYLKFKAEDTSMFINDSASMIMGDAPTYMNGTLYVPIIPILDALKIDYRTEGSEIIIGGMYTDGTGKPSDGTTTGIDRANINSAGTDTSGTTGDSTTSVGESVDGEYNSVGFPEDNTSDVLEGNNGTTSSD